MECRAFDHTAVDDLGVHQVKVYYETGFQKCGTVLSDVFDFYEFLRRTAEIEAVVVKCTLILYFGLSGLVLSYRRSGFYQQLHQT